MKKLLFLCCVAAVLFAQAPKKKSALAARIDALLDDGLSANAFWGVLVVDAKTGRVVYARNEHHMFAPASNTKLFTTATALETFGPKFTTRTTIEMSPRGDLVLVGRGDANLSPRVFPFDKKSEFSGATTVALDKLADQVVAAGVKSVPGDVIGDDSYFLFERYPEGWTVDDTLWSYGAPVSAIVINDNELKLDISPGASPSERPTPKLDPYGDYFSIDTTELYSFRGDPAWPLTVRREPGSRIIRFVGVVPAGDQGFHQTLAVDDPAELAARYLRDALIARGVEVKGGAKAKHARWIDSGMDLAWSAAVDGGPIPNVAFIDSRTLAEDIKVVNKVSQNLHAEIWLRFIGHGSLKRGLNTERDFLLKAGLSKDEFYFLDGSGLSRAGLVAPNATVRLLTYMDKSANRDVWLDSLPVGGVDGSLRNRLQTECTSGNVQAKTGTFRHTSALSGYMSASHRHRLIFSLMVNNYTMPTATATGIMDKVLDELCRAQ